jgi:methionyl-tRNA formyltransferase
MNKLIVVGNDKLGRKFINNIEREKFNIVLDSSSSLKRVFKLIKKRKISPGLIVKMFLADLFRKETTLMDEYDQIENNQDLIDIVKKNNIDLVVLYRGGLIVNKNFLDLGIKILNIHCAKIPEYGGIGVLDRALRDQAYQQEATLHVITESIDDGEVVLIEPYALDKQLSYKLNEEIAYDAGISLFNKFMK